MNRLGPITEPCAECGETISGPGLSVSQSNRRHGKSLRGPFCSVECSANNRRIYPDRATNHAMTEMRKRAKGECIECSAKHTSGKYRCKKCVRKSGNRSGTNKPRNKCGRCGERGHYRPTCEAQL